MFYQNEDHNYITTTTRDGLTSFCSFDMETESRRPSMITHTK
jgi:hypothetical protein